MSPKMNSAQMPDRRLSSTSTSTQLSTRSIASSISTIDSAASSPTLLPYSVSNTYHNLSYPSITDIVLSTNIHSNTAVPTPTTRRRTRDIPRPPNSFILYRRDKSSGYPKMTAAELSKIIGLEWHNEKPAIKEMYARRAKEEAELHSLKYPNYRYQPLRRRSTKKAQQSTLTARAGIRLTATNGEIFTTPLLNSQCTPSQIVRVPSSFPFVANKNKNNKSFFYQTKHTSSSPQVKQERLKASPFVFPSPLSKKSSSLNSQYGQSKAMTISPSLFLLSSYDQKPLAQFVPSASSLPVVNSNSGLCIGLTDPRLWPESFNTMPPFHGTSGAHSALWSVNDVNRVRPSNGNLEFPSYSNEKGPPSSSFYFSQLMNADITVAMNMAPPAGPSFPNKSLVHESSFNGGLYVQPITSDRSYQTVVSPNLPCSTTKYTPSPQDLIPSMKTEPVFVSPIMMDQDMDVSPVLSTCSSYSSLHDAATSGFSAESSSSGARHFESQIKTQSELVSQMLAHNLY